MPEAAPRIEARALGGDFLFPFLLLRCGARVKRLLPGLGVRRRGVGGRKFPRTAARSRCAARLGDGRQAVAVNVRHALAHVLRLHAVESPRQAVRVARLVDHAKVAAVALRQHIAALVERGGESLAAVGAAPQFREFVFQRRRIDPAALGGADFPKFKRRLAIKRGLRRGRREVKADFKFVARSPCECGNFRPCRRRAKSPRPRDSKHVLMRPASLFVFHDNALMTFKP